MMSRPVGLRTPARLVNVSGVTTEPSLILPALSSDLAALTRLCGALWPDEHATAHKEHAAAVVSGQLSAGMPVVFFVAEVRGAVIGFIEVGLRSHADGCDDRHPVGYVEGWYVDRHHQRGGIGAALMGAAEAWALSQGASEIASDTWVDNAGSQRAHEALGFAVVDRCVHYRKGLR